MRRYLILLALLVLMPCTNLRAAELLGPDELIGIYTGSIKYTSYLDEKPAKHTEGIILEVTSPTVIKMTEGDNTYTGEMLPAGSHIFFRVSAGAIVLSGRFQAKGKPGKVKISGLTTTIFSGYAMVADGKMKLKQLP